MTAPLLRADPDSFLVVPTSTMAEHARHQLARAQLPVRPSRVMTFARLLTLLGAPAAPSAARLDSILVSLLDRPEFERFRAVAGYRGFRVQLAALFDEVEREHLPRDLAQMFDAVEHALQPLALRGRRLRIAARSHAPLPRRIVFDGFFSLSRAEQNLIDRLASRCSVTVMPPQSGADSPRDAFSALSMEQEIEEIARRILQHRSRGRDFRDIGVILRSHDPYAPALETAFARFGIPARFYFASPLAACSQVDYFRRIIRAMLAGWDREQLLGALRMPVSGIGATPEGDRLDFEWRHLLPQHGPPDWLAPIDPWRSDRTTPADWAARLQNPAQFRRSTSSDVTSPGDATLWSAFADCLHEAAALLPATQEILLADFFHALESVIDLTTFRAPDRRRDVVHVMDVFEARQWQLPVVFIPGMVERHFPQYIREDALLGDAARARAGLKTSADAQREERLLFDLAVTRATEHVTLSYPRFDDKGDPLLRSFFLSEDAPLRQARVRPRPSRIATPSAALPIPDRAALAARHRTVSVSSLETFLQCPFQFFARRTLHLRVRPPAPRDRLDNLLQGTVMHAALAALERLPLLGAAVFDHVFDQEAARARLPRTYRTEAVRLEMLRNFETFLASDRFATGWPARVEEAFEFPLTPSLSIRGRIDRLEVSLSHQALVIDYKYSVANTIREKIGDHEDGSVVQAGLYLLVAQKQFGLEPAGMFYAGLKNQVQWGGWHLPIPSLHGFGESCTRQRLEELTAGAETRALAAVESILAGQIAPEPASLKKCSWCDFRDICRIETQPVKAPLQDQ